MCLSAFSPCLQTSLHPVGAHPQPAPFGAILYRKSKTFKTLASTITFIQNSKFIIAGGDKSKLLILNSSLSEKVFNVFSLCKSEALQGCWM